MLRVFLAMIALAISIHAARAQAVSDADRQAFESVISAQIGAFRADDEPRAYGYAAPIIKQLFPTPERFMDMVKRGYQPVYRPQSYRFGKAEIDSAGRPIQRVMIVGPDGFSYEAIYTMERQPDGSWQISGCRLVKMPDYSA